MKTINISERLSLNVPDGYIAPALPFRDEWIRALRSGSFPQGKGTLRTPDGEYCCLGILSEIQGRLIKTNIGWVIGWVDGHAPYNSRLSHENPIYNSIGPIGELQHDDIVAWFLGIQYGSLAGLNDAGASFEEISLVIERIWSQPVEASTPPYRLTDSIKEQTLKQENG
jgi:hypothetical protein